MNQSPNCARTHLPRAAGVYLYFTASCSAICPLFHTSIQYPKMSTRFHGFHSFHIILDFCHFCPQFIPISFPPLCCCTLTLSRHGCNATVKDFPLSSYFLPAAQSSFLFLRVLILTFQFISPISDNNLPKSISSFQLFLLNSVLATGWHLSYYTPWHTISETKTLNPNAFKPFWWALSSGVSTQVKLPLKGSFGTCPKTPWKNPTEDNYPILHALGPTKKNKRVFFCELQIKMQVKEQTPRNWAMQRFPARLQAIEHELYSAEMSDLKTISVWCKWPGFSFWLLLL